MELSKRNFLIGSTILLLGIMVIPLSLAAGSKPQHEHAGISYRNGTPYIDYHQSYTQDDKLILTKKPNKRFRQNMYPYIPKNSIVINNGAMNQKLSKSK